MSSLIFAQKHYHLDSTDSSNSHANRLLLKEELPEGTVISAGEQTAGKGQHGNTWTSSPNENLTFSILLRPSFLRVKDQFQLSLFACLGCADYVSSKLENSDRLAGIRIKWPNDILLNQKKLAGLLIENQVTGDQIRVSILGIGMNMNQDFSGQAFPAISLSSLTGVQYNLKEELNHLCGFLEKRYLQLRRGGTDKLISDYLSILFGKDELRNYRVGERQVSGILTGVDAEGKLELQFENEKKKFGNKEISFLI